jgi:uncharacterized Zn-binding protein involved in type VI secretion
MPKAARIGDLTSHLGVISGPGYPKVRIEGVPAARVNDNHACALPPPAGPHPTTMIVTGSTKVRIGGQYAARVGDTCGCGAQLSTGASKVFIGG